MTGSSAFLHFKASEPQHIGTENTEMHHQSKKPLYTKDFQSIFNDKKKTVGQYDCINLLFLISIEVPKKISELFLGLKNLKCGF